MSRVSARADNLPESAVGTHLRRLFRPRAAPSAAVRRLAVVTAVATYAIIVVGGVVRVTGSGLGCDAPGDNGWPLCRGRLLPPLEEHALIEFSHRWLAAVASFLLLALVVVAWSRYRRLRSFTAGVSAVVVLLAVQIALGQLTVQYHLPGWMVMVHLANAELLLGALVWSVVALWTADVPVTPTAAARRAAAAAVTAAAAVYVLVLSGALVVAKGAGYACRGWPLCSLEAPFGTGALAADNVLHRVVAALVAGLLLRAVFRVRQVHASLPLVRRAAVAVAVLLVAQIAAGAVAVGLRLPPAWRSLHEALASALWAAAVFLALVSVAAARVGTAVPAEAPVPSAPGGTREIAGALPAQEPPTGPPTGGGADATGPAAGVPSSAPGQRPAMVAGRDRP